MAAYAALVSVMQIIHHPFLPISLDKKQVESLTEIVTFLQEFLEGYNSPVSDSNEADPLEMRIADAAYAAEDVMESNIADQIFPPQLDRTGFFNCFRNLKEPKNDGENSNSLDLYEGLKKVIEDMDLIKKEVQDHLQRQVSASASLTRLNSSPGSSLTRMNTSSRSSPLTRLNSTMVGVDDVSLELMDKLTSEERSRQVIPIVGMGGMGKTTLARNVYARPFINEHFDIRAWTTISQNYNARDILCDLLCQVNKERTKEQLSNMSKDDVGSELRKHLFGRRFLIVMDDMWSIKPWENMQRYFPDNGNRSRIVVTTRLSTLGSQLANSYCLQMKFLDDDSSWKLFLKTVFREERFPPELEIVGKKIVESCRGLPLSIVVTGGLLEKLERTKKSWETIRGNINSLVNLENDEHCLKILKLSYNHLPVYLKPCFLYMAVFEEDNAIRVSNLIKLWVSEGFLKPIGDESLETIAQGFIKELADRNLILVGLGSTGKAKYCWIHDLLRDLCLRESQNQRFYHVVGKRSLRSTSRQRCIVIPRGSSKKKVHNAMKSSLCARSCIYDGERVRVLPNLRLLRTFKAYDRYDHYQRGRYSLGKMFELVNLRFLAVRANQFAKLPSSINLLWSLQTLIVSHPSEKVDACVEIWMMPQLRHVEFYNLGFKSYDLGLHLPDPPRDNVVIMENLQMLVGIRNFKCDEDVVRRIPNINKLGLIYDDDKGTPESNDDHYSLHNIQSLQKLESLSCVCHGDDDYLKNLSFPDSLKKLNLMMMKMSGDFEDMIAKIGSLPLLQKLSLYGWGSATGTWELVEDQFPSLKFLSLKWIWGLKMWTTESSPFPCLEHLHLLAIEDLKEIPREIGEIPTLKSVVLQNCGESVVKSMKEIVEEQEELQGDDDLLFKVQVVLIWEDEELKKLASRNFEVIVPGIIHLDDPMCNCLTLI